MASRRVSGQWGRRVALGQDFQEPEVTDPSTTDLSSLLCLPLLFSLSALETSLFCPALGSTP